MENCKSCEGKGFIEYSFKCNAGGFNPSIRQCHGCNDTVKYSREIQRRYAEKPLAQKPFAKLQLVVSNAQN